VISIEKQILFLLSHVPGIEIRELIQIYQARDYSPQHIRNTLSQLKKAGYVKSPTRSTYTITDNGQLLLDSTNKKPLKYDQDWNNAWYLVMLEIPESSRRIRDLFRADLLRLGFGMLYNSVYITPWNYTNEVMQLINSYQIANSVTILKGDFLTNAITPEKAWQIWRLDAVNELYLRKREWFQREFLPAYEALTKDSSPLDIFVLFLHLGEHLSEIFLVDPMLPKTILPPNWLGFAVCAEFSQALREITSRIPNDSYYSQFIKGLALD